LASADVLMWRLSVELRLGQKVSEHAERIASRIGELKTRKSYCYDCGGQRPIVEKWITRQSKINRLGYCPRQFKICYSASPPASTSAAYSARRRACDCLIIGA
jgi:hypothetical protein